MARVVIVLIADYGMLSDTKISRMFEAVNTYVYPGEDEALAYEKAMADFCKEEAEAHNTNLDATYETLITPLEVRARIDGGDYLVVSDTRTVEVG